MTKREAYKLGQRLGSNAARYCDSPGEREGIEAGCSCDNAAEELCESCLTVAAYESEQGARDYSPWERYASEINAARDSEGQWEAYDAGVAAGIKAGVKTRLAARA